LLFCALSNLLEFLAAIITSWIDIIGGHISPEDCALSMIDSATVEGWMKKLYFSKAGNDPIQALSHLYMARKYVQVIF
jgi:hypothetical protein